MLKMVRLIIEGEEALVLCEGCFPLYVRLKVEASNHYYLNCKSYDHRELLRCAHYDVFTNEEFVSFYGYGSRHNCNGTFYYLKSSLSDRILTISHADILRAIDSGHFVECYKEGEF